MLADNRLCAAYQTERVFRSRPDKVSAASRKSGRQRNRVQHVSPQGDAAFALSRTTEVVHALYNVAIVQQKAIGNMV